MCELFFLDSANIISDPILLEQYVAIGDYTKEKSNECSLTAGQTVEVIEKNENGQCTTKTLLYGVNFNGVKIL